MAKRVSFGSKPKSKQKIKDVEDWIKDGKKSYSTKEEVETVRFTIDIPVKLHAQMKYHCAIKKISMKGEIQNLFEKHFSISNSS